MSFIFKRLRLYIPVLIMAAIFMLTGHFCVANANASIPHSHAQQSHTSGIAEDNFKACCQQNHTENLNNSAVINKNDGLVTSNHLSFVLANSYTTSLILESRQTPDPNISPHQFKESSFKILLC